MASTTGPQAIAPPSTGRDVRLAARSGSLTTQTCGLAPSYLQANLIVLPSRYAADFRQLCWRNPVPCPLIAESSRPGDWASVRSYLPGLEGASVLSDLDLRHDVPGYNVYVDARPTRLDCRDVAAEWTDDHVAFLIGCSYSFEAALASTGLVPRQMALGRNVPMYRTTLPLCPSGVFTGGVYVVSMRPYREADVEAVRRITGAYTLTHGEPIAWGWDAARALGIRDICDPDWGDEPLTSEGGRFVEVEGGEVPVFWGCGVTPQEAVMRAKLEGVVMAHSPGSMLLLDCEGESITKTQAL
jgi:uncharacterized protein YcsI (UPF0317 family)